MRCVCMWTRIRTCVSSYPPVFHPSPGLHRRHQTRQVVGRRPDSFIVLGKADVFGGGPAAVGALGPDSDPALKEKFD